MQDVVYFLGVPDTVFFLVRNTIYVDWQHEKISQGVDGHRLSSGFRNLRIHRFVGFVSADRTMAKENWRNCCVLLSCNFIWEVVFQYVALSGRH